MRYPTIDAGPRMALDYDRYWARRGGVRETLSPWQLKRAEIAARFIECGATVLDLGAGNGAMLSYWQERLGVHPIGVDVSKSSLAAMRVRGIEALDVDVENASAIASLPEVDYLTGFEILEHMPNPEALIHALAPKARKGMLFSFPNTGYWRHRVRLFFGRFPLQWIAHPGEHVRFWTVSDARYLFPAALEGSGFVLKDLVVYEGVPGLSHLFPNLFGEGILIHLARERALP